MNTRKTTVTMGRDIDSSLFRTIDSDSRSYYSGSDVRVEFDGIPVDDVAGISYKIIEPIRFQFGFASRTSRRTSRGQRMVQGQILMNFKDPSQLFFLLNKIKNNNTPDVQGIDPLKRQQVLNVLSGSNTPPAQVKALLNLTPDQVRKSNRLSSGNTYGSSPNRDALIAFRDSMWGRPEDPNNPDSLSIKDPQINPLYASKIGGFNIRLIFGEPNYQNPRTTDQSGRQVGAVTLIRGVEIMSEAMDITETGEAFRSIYEFMAVDLDTVETFDD